MLAGDRSRLGLGTEPASKNFSDSSVVETIAVQLRRRRAASYRLPPLADGRRDPLDPVRRSGR